MAAKAQRLHGYDEGLRIEGTTECRRARLMDCRSLHRGWLLGGVQTSAPRLKWPFALPDGYQCMHHLNTIGPQRKTGVHRCYRLGAASHTAAPQASQPQQPASAPCEPGQYQPHLRL